MQQQFNKWTDNISSPKFTANNIALPAGNAIAKKPAGGVKENLSITKAQSSKPKHESRLTGELALP